MTETTERKRIAARIQELCAALDADSEYTGDESEEVAEALQETALARSEELHALMADLARRPIRNEGDVARRASSMLTYLECVRGRDEVARCPVGVSLKAIMAYARRRIPKQGLAIATAIVLIL